MPSTSFANNVHVTKNNVSVASIVPVCFLLFFLFDDEEILLFFLPHFQGAGRVLRIIVRSSGSQEEGSRQKSKSGYSTKMKAAKGQLVLKRIYKQLKKNPNSSSKEIQMAKAAYLAAKSNRAVVKKAQSAGETKEVTSVRSIQLMIVRDCSLFCMFFFVAAFTFLHFFIMLMFYISSFLEEYEYFFVLFFFEKPQCFI